MPIVKQSRATKEKRIPTTANMFVRELSTFKSKADSEKNSRYFYDSDKPGSKCMGIRFGTIFKLAKDFSDMSIAEIEKLLENEFYEVRMGAVSIMDFQARNKKTEAGRRKELFDLYIKRHDRINNWDMVDRSAPYVVGGYLSDKPRGILYKLAKSKDPWQRRTAIVSTYFFIRQNDLDDTFRIAGLLVADKHELVQKAVGSWLRTAGQKSKPELLAFLDKHAAKMPRTMLRYATEKLDKKKKEYYLTMK